jgi:hypothetical protein
MLIGTPAGGAGPPMTLAELPRPSESEMSLAEASVEQKSRFVAFTAGPIATISVKKDSEMHVIKEDSEMHCADTERGKQVDGFLQVQHPRHTHSLSNFTTLTS